MDDGGDVLGNLPRTRPGRRSEKRSSNRQSPAAARQEPPPASQPPEPDPVGGAIRAAAGVAGAGIRVANGITREVLRRLPRP
jgi:hypothetical protein